MRAHRSQPLGIRALSGRRLLAQRPICTEATASGGTSSRRVANRVEEDGVAGIIGRRVAGRETGVLSQLAVWTAGYCAAGTGPTASHSSIPQVRHNAGAQNRLAQVKWFGLSMRLTISPELPV